MYNNNMLQSIPLTPAQQSNWATIQRTLLTSKGAPNPIMIEAYAKAYTNHMSNGWDIWPHPLRKNRIVSKNLSGHAYQCISHIVQKSKPGKTGGRLNP